MSAQAHVIEIDPAPRGTLSLVVTVEPVPAHDAPERPQSVIGRAREYMLRNAATE